MNCFALAMVLCLSLSQGRMGLSSLLAIHPGGATKESSPPVIDIASLLDGSEGEARATTVAEVGAACRKVSPGLPEH